VRKLSINAYINVTDRIFLGAGIQYGGQEAFKDNWITIKAGFAF